MGAGRIDVLAAMDEAAQAIEREGAMYEGAYRLVKARAAVAELIAALDHIAALSRALRFGGPEPEDLSELSDALIDATDTAHIALARIAGDAA